MRLGRIPREVLCLLKLVLDESEWIGGESSIESGG